MSRYGASTFSSLLNSCVLWAPLQHSAGVSGDIDEFPIIPSGVTVTNNGTFTKTSLGNNKSVLNFDGSTNYISLTDNAAWDIFESNFTICGWVKFTAINELQSIVSQYVNNNNYWLWRYANTSSTLRIYSLSSGTERFAYYYSFSPSANTWYHITMQRSGSTLLVYINGISISVTITIAWNGTLALVSPLYIGTFPDATNKELNGNIKDLMIWKGRALSQPEIKLLMNRTHPITGAGLLPGGYDYWRTS